MCLPRIGRWSESLRHILPKVYEPTTRTPVPWLLNGEAALALQGVDAEPAIIQFMAASPFAVAYFSGFMKQYLTPANSATVIYRRGGDIAPSDNWRSNVHQHIVAWEHNGAANWLGRWNIDGYPVEVLYTRRADPLSSVAQENTRRLRFEDMDVAVVPLEVMLADSVRHNQTPITNRILHALRASGYSADTLQKALDALPTEKASRLLRLLEIRLVAG